MAEPLHPFTTSDGQTVHYRHYEADAAPRGRVVFLHGIQSHGGWYGRSCRELAGAGLEVFFLDRRGCGHNRERRGDAGSFRRLLDDVGEFVKTLPTDRPITLAGISWGGKLAGAFPFRHPGLVQKIALLCPGFFPKVSPGLLSKALIARCALTNPARMFPIPLNDPELFTASPAGREMIRNDPLALREATARMLFQSAALDIYLRRASKRVNIPTLLMLAGRDRIIDNDRTRRFVEGFRTDKTILEYPDSHHTLELEEPGHPFVGDLIRWVG